MSSPADSLLREVRGVQSILEVCQLCMTFRSGNIATDVLKGVDLVVKRGEFVAIMGPSGCGKSTLLHIMGGLLQPTSGRVHVDGVSVHGVSDRERTELRRSRIGFVFQRFNLLPTLSARDNVRLAQELRGNGGQEGEIERVMDTVGLGDKLHHRPSELSGGEQQRVSVARAIIGRPALLLADEPTGSLDSVNSRTVLQLLRDLNETCQQTVIMITHDSEAASYAGRIVEMKDGRILNRVQNVVYAMGTGVLV